jgi:F420-non-reducing hydrogenase small subunit
MSATGKPKFAMYWAASCGGCEIATLNIHEKLLDFDANFEPVFWPVAMDGKIKDVQAMADKSILLTLFNGGIHNDENEEMAHLLRRKSQILVSFGSCACEGGIPGLANLSSLSSMFDTAYHNISTPNPENIFPSPVNHMPEGDLHIPTLYPVLKTLDQVVAVDYYMPGCPPESDQIATVIDLVIKVIQGKADLPPRGTTIGASMISLVGSISADASTLCDECKRKRNIKKIEKFTRIQELTKIDPDLCLLEQGIPCNGPATRSGCGAVCPKANAQCIGCYGPADGVEDFGARLMSAFASVIDSKDPQEIDRILDGIVDPAGQFYRFSLASSLLRSAKPAWKGE